jgi:hypothetical protein
MKYLAIYANLRFAIRKNDITYVNTTWQQVLFFITQLYYTIIYLFFQLWVLFHATGKTNYAKLTLYVQHVLANVHPSIYSLNYL